VSPSGKAPDSGSGIPRFESLHPSSLLLFRNFERVQKFAFVQKSGILLLSLMVAAEIGACPISSAQAPAAAQSPVPVVVRTPEVAKDAVKMASTDFKNYLVVMRPLMHHYLHIMLTIISPDGLPPEDSLDTKVTAQDIEGLREQLAKVKPPVELEQQHASLDKSLNAVAQFIQTGGTSKIGFHSALQLAQQMQAISNSYHESVLALIQEHGLSAGSDPFIVEKVTEKVAAKEKKVQSSKVQSSKTVPSLDAQSRTPGVPQVNSSYRVNALSGAAAGVDFDTASKVPSSASTTPTMIDGVGGSMGLSGMFNGLGGTGTNGLVDGMGFSSGLNGFVNGAGASSGMSGMLNDINTSSASDTSK
jgi:hypothetical protein